jgi:predicted HTH domain antitoxin
MTLQVPDTVAAQADCTAPELIFGMVIGLFFQGRLSLGQAGAALGLSKPDLMRQLNERGLPMPYGADDAARDLAVIDRLWGHGNTTVQP